MDTVSTTIYQFERHVNAALTHLVMRHGTYGFQVNTKETLGIAGFSTEILRTLYTRLKKNEKKVVKGTTCLEADDVVYDLQTENFDFARLPKWLLVVLTEKDLTLSENISTLCRWCRRLKAWRCHCLVVVLSATTAPINNHTLACVRNMIQGICQVNPELQELRLKQRVRLFQIPHWECLEKIEHGFIEVVQQWLLNPSLDMEPPDKDNQYMSYRDISKILIRDAYQALPQLDIFLRLLIMCIVGVFSVCLTLVAIVAITKDTGLAHDVSKAQGYLISHLESRRTTKSDWGRTHNPVILVALQLHNPQWCKERTENQRSVDRLEIGILSSLTKLSIQSSVSSDFTRLSMPSPSIPDYTPHRLASDINALLATNHNPRDFHDHDLVMILEHFVSDVIPYTQYSAHSYSSYVIALSNSGVSLPSFHADRILQKRKDDGSFSLGINEAVLSMIALSCMELTDRHHTEIDHIIAYIRAHRYTDGSYGSIYSTSLVLQAYNITGQPIDSRDNKELTMSWLTRHCYGNSAIKDPDVASSVLLALSGRTPLDMRNELAPPTVVRRPNRGTDTENTGS